MKIDLHQQIFSEGPMLVTTAHIGAATENKEVLVKAHYYILLTAS